MLSPDLVSFVKEGLGRGLSRGEIEDILVRAGWPADQVRRSLAGFADVGSPIPVPRPAVSTRPREAFLYVVMFMALFVSAFNLGAVLFALVDLALPDPAGVPPELLRELLRLSVSALVVASPVFAYVAQVVRRGVEAQPSARTSRIRLQLHLLDAIHRLLRAGGRGHRSPLQLPRRRADGAIRAEGADRDRDRGRGVRQLAPAHCATCVRRSGSPATPPLCAVATRFRRSAPRR